MLELLLQAEAAHHHQLLLLPEFADPPLPAFGWAGAAAAAADAAGPGGPRAEVGGAAADAEDAQFDQFFFETLQLPVGCAPAAGDVLVGGVCDMIDEFVGLVGKDDDDAEATEFLADFLLMDCDAAVGGAAAEAEDVEEEEDDSASSSSPSTFEPTSPTPSYASELSSRSKAAAAAAGASPAVSGGRVEKKKEANREAAYRYRMKQRLSDSALEARRAELQSRADELAGRVSGAESEAQFLMQMCRQIFSSRRQLTRAAEKV